MQVYEDLDAARPIGKSAVALGFFDGLHLGHQAVIRKAAAWKEKGLLPEVFTFTIQHAAPQKKAAAGRLLTERHKWGLLGEGGIQMVLSPAFTAFQAMEPEEFVRRVLVEKLDAGLVREKLADLLKGTKQKLRSVTLDRGTEFTQGRELTKFPTAIFTAAPSK